MKSTSRAPALQVEQEPLTQNSELNQNLKLSKSHTYSPDDKYFVRDSGPPNSRGRARRRQRNSPRGRNAVVLPTVGSSWVESTGPLMAEPTALDSDGS